MFIEFEFGNFRSFRDRQKFSMEASPLRSNDSGLEEGNVFESNAFRLLKTKAIYGSNASGKSNLAKAIAAFVSMVSKSVAHERLTLKIWGDRFQLITDWDDQPIFFQYTFLLNGTVYRYGFQILQAVVTYEWLYSGTGKEETEYFMRSPGALSINDNYIKASSEFLKSGINDENELFRKDALFLTAASLNGNKLLAQIRDAIRGIAAIDGVNDASALQYAMGHLVQGSMAQRTAIRRFLTAADTGINDIEPRELPEHSIDTRLKDNEGNPHKVFDLYSLHQRYDENGKAVDKIAVPFAEWESEGTAKLFGVGTLIINALADGHAIIIDEFDARFHPNLTLKIVQLFNNEKSNPLKAQLIFVTHDATLLRRANFRRDQVCLIDKDKYGISSLTNLIEYKGVRKDASYDKEYLNGSYNAVPFLEELDWVLTAKPER